MSAGAKVPSPNRRRFLRQATATATGIALASSAGCLDLFGLGGGGATGRGGGPTFQDIYREDADVVVESAAALETETNRGNGRIVWIPSDTQIDITGRNLTVRNATIASGRSDEESGALIATSDRGHGSPAMVMPSSPSKKAAGSPA